MSDTKFPLDDVTLATLDRLLKAAQRVVLHAYGTTPRHTRRTDGTCRIDCTPCGLNALAAAIDHPPPCP